MARDFIYIRNKKTGVLSRTLARPYLGQNSECEELTEEEFVAAKAALAGAVTEAGGGAGASDIFAEVDNSDLGEGVEEGGEDSR